MDLSEGKTYCVTGATGYIGSWLVNSLLQRGCTVHATIRNPERASHFLNLWGGNDRMRLFTADLNEDGSFDDAVRGCDGVFHVAASLELLTAAPDSDLETNVKTQVTDNAVKGTLNVLKACLKSNVNKVVFTSSISTLKAKDKLGRWLPIVDELCLKSADDVFNIKEIGWVYVLMKLLAEETAFQFAKENGINLVSVITTTVAGPFLTPTVPTSLQFLLSPLTGDSKMLPLLEAVNCKMGSVPLVHIEDICRAHMFLMDNVDAVGRYICCSGSYTLNTITEILGKAPHFTVAQRVHDTDEDTAPVEISSKRIKELGFEYMYDGPEIIRQTLQSCLDCGLITSQGNMNS